MAFVSVSSVIFYEDDGSSVLWTPAIQPNINIGYESNYEGIISNQAFGGEKYTVEKYGKRYAWNLEWSFLTEAERTNAEALVDYADGRLNWFQWTPDGGSTKYSVYFEQDSFQFQEVAYRAFSVSFRMIEKL